ncbi:GNAT family N-acetyltransferase [Streptomyces cyaneofuscatus]|uniref:GNAT family N-acetyltransferase n=1 Tax=Streptomyces cyaneofuscatus TaxID=66883 RepID=UPI003F552281
MSALDPATRPQPAAPTAAPTAAPAAGAGAPHPLDNPALSSLTGPHAHFAERHGRILRYPVDVTPWTAHPDVLDAQDWADLAALAGPGGTISLNTLRQEPPKGWEILHRVAGVQLVDVSVDPAPDAEAVRLGPADVPEMLDLVERTRPGPFLPRTVELGTYLGIRRGGALVAMAGERLHPPGWTEISGVCTDESVRGQGLASRLVRAVAYGIRERGETPFLHTSAANAVAIRLYESLGFQLRARPEFLAGLAPVSFPPADGTRRAALR